MKDLKEIITELEKSKTKQDWQMNEQHQKEIETLKQKYNIKNFSDRIGNKQFEIEFLALEKKTK